MPLTTIQIDQDVLQGIECDVVVDALPGLEPSTQLITAFLKRGVDVLSANKAVMADSGSALGALATRYEASLRYSATVGGSAPIIEAVPRIAASGNIISVTTTDGDVQGYAARALLEHKVTRAAQSGAQPRYS